MTIAEMKKKNQEIGHHFFDKDTIEYWNSKIETEPNKYNLFVESHDNFYEDKRLYSVRLFTLDGRVHTIDNPDEKTGDFFDKKSSCSFRDKLSECMLGQPNKCVDNADGTYTLTYSNGDEQTIDTKSFKIVSDEKNISVYPDLQRFTDDVRKENWEKTNKPYKIINEFCERECDTQADFDDETDVVLAETETADEWEIPVTISADLVQNTITYTLDERVTEKVKYNSLDELVAKIENSTLDDLLSDIPQSTIKECVLKQTLDEIDEEAEIFDEIESELDLTQEQERGRT